MGKKKLIAETGAGQHGVALASAAALMGLECEIHMGEIDIKKEWPNVRRMQVLGAKVVPATAGGKSLKEAVDKQSRAGKIALMFQRAVDKEMLEQTKGMIEKLGTEQKVGAELHIEMEQKNAQVRMARLTAGRPLTLNPNPNP